MSGGAAYFDSSAARIINNLFDANFAIIYNSGFGAAIYFENSSLYISGNKFVNNISYEGGGAIACKNSSSTIIKFNIFYNNETYGMGWDSPDGGAAILMENSDLLLINNTFYGNNSFGGHGGGLSCYASNPVILNSILWADTAHNYNEIYSDTLSSPQITYSDIAGGYEGETNIDTYPIFVDDINGDLHLWPGSPCIDAGDPNSPLDPDGTTSDMGAFYFDQRTGIDLEPQIPLHFKLAQNYPNPFNASTMISYELPYQARVTLDIYDILGRKITALEDGLQAAGYHQLLWQPGDIASGMYFYKLQAGNFNVTKKMLLIK
jgi:predicted outer membrane repeat protein